MHFNRKTMVIILKGVLYIPKFLINFMIMDKKCVLVFG